MSDTQFIPAIQNDLDPTATGYGESWQVVNFLEADDVRFTGTHHACEEFIRARAAEVEAA